MKKIGMNGSCMVHYNATKLAVLFALVGSMMIVMPMLIEQVSARTDGRAQTSAGGHQPPFTNVKGKLDVGKWKVHPKILDNGRRIEWVTVGSGVFGGDEKGTIDADFGPGRHVKFTWFNPDNSNSFNRCTINWTGKLVGWCSILTPAGVTSGPFANARFTVSTSCDIFRCQENGSVDQNVRFDDLLLHHGPIIIHHDLIDIHPPNIHPPEFDFPIPNLDR